MTPLPSRPADLTPAWLSEVLGARVVSVQVLDHAFATNQRARIALTYEKSGAGPESLFAKLAPLDEGHRQMIGAIGIGGGAGTGGDEACAIEGLKATFGDHVTLPVYPAAAR